MNDELTQRLQAYVVERLPDEENPRVRGLEHPFFVMQEITGYEASPVAITQAPYAEHAEAYGREKYEILGRIARAEPERIGLLSHFTAPAPADCWQRELAHWEATSTCTPSRGQSSAISRSESGNSSSRRLSG